MRKNAKISNEKQAKAKYATLQFGKANDEINKKIKKILMNQCDGLHCIIV